MNVLNQSFLFGSGGSAPPDVLYKFIHRSFHLTQCVKLKQYASKCTRILSSTQRWRHQSAPWCIRRIDDGTEDGLCHQWPAVMMRDRQDGSDSVWTTRTGSVRHAVDRVRWAGGPIGRCRSASLLSPVRPGPSPSAPPRFWDVNPAVC